MHRFMLGLIALGVTFGSAAAQVPPVPTATTAPLAAPNAAPNASPFPAEMTIIAQNGVEARSGPTLEYYPTSKLRYGDRVVVLRESKDQPGWYAIKPPFGSFSWISGKYVKPVDQRTGYVEVEGNGAAPVLPGSSLVNKEPNVESTKIASGSLVTILDRPMQVNGQSWYPIVPPPSEVRFIPKDAVMPPQTASVAPPNWTRPAQANQPQPAPGAPGQLTGIANRNTVGTPASLSQPASPWTQYNGVSAQPPQWSQWGKLRRTAFDKDGQPMFVLEDRNGRPLMYVTSAPGTSLRNYIDQTVCLFGSVSYRSDGVMRSHYMIASHVATP